MRYLCGLALGTVLLAAGCAPLNYTLRPGAGDVVVVPPHLPADVQIADGVFRVSFPNISNEPACSFDTGAFAAHPEPGALVVTARYSKMQLSSQAAAIDTPGGSIQSLHGHPLADDQAFADLRKQILRLDAAGCFRGSRTVDPVWQVLQALPLASQDAVALANNDTVAGSYFEVLPGEELEIITPLLDGSGKVVGPATLWYRVAVMSDGRLRIVPPGAASLRALDPKREGLHPQMLTLPRDPVARYWRVAILGTAAASAIIRTNLVLASSDLGALADATSLVVAHPEECEMTGAVRCFAPKFGTVIRLPWIKVTVHGKVLHVPHGATVAQALKAAGAPAPALSRLRVKRLYGHKSITVKAPPSLLLQLHLLGGERIDW